MTESNSITSLKNWTLKRKTQLKKDEIRPYLLSLSNMCQANLFKEILMIINTNSRRREQERERQNDAHGIVYALAERTNSTCEENYLKRNDYLKNYATQVAEEKGVHANAEFT